MIQKWVVIIIVGFALFFLLRLLWRRIRKKGCGEACHEGGCDDPQSAHQCDHCATYDDCPLKEVLRQAEQQKTKKK